VVKVYRFAPCNTTSTMIEFNTSTITVTGGINELNINGFVNITKDIPSPIKVETMKFHLCSKIDLSRLLIRYPDAVDFAKM
jgi:hypothetical protein